MGKLVVYRTVEGKPNKKIYKDSKFNPPEEVAFFASLNGKKIDLGKIAAEKDTEPDVNQPPTVELGPDRQIKLGTTEIIIDADVRDDRNLVTCEWQLEQGTGTLTVDPADNTLAKLVVPDNLEQTLTIAAIARDDAGQEVTDKVLIEIKEEVEPGPGPGPEPETNVLYDSTIHSKLHDGNVRTIKKEGNITTPGGLGIECRASGNPRIQVNEDKTFSLLCDAGHGRFYFYVLNYNTTLEIECAFWNETKGQDLSLKMRSRHNESGACSNRFGGYGLAIDRNGWGAKRETCHNNHDQSSSGSLPSKPETKKFFTIRHTVKDEGNGVRQIGEMDGKQFMSKIDNNPEAYMIDQDSFKKQSYGWVRSNIDSGTGEIRIKKLRILKV